MADLVSHPDEVKVVSKRFGLGATNIDRYLELDGYKAVQKALSMGADGIVNEVKNSGLRGRGGAGFSTGLKWSFVPKQAPKPKYVLCNGDESEPGTCKDRLIFEHDPHAVIEGVMIAGLAVGSKTGYIYVRGEYRYLLEIVQKAIADAYARGFLGKNIFGSGQDFDIYWHGGAGAYEVGEESALMESLEGKRGIPRIRPPFPAVVGLWGGPTVINNAETLASVPHIIMGGAEWYAKLGPPKNGGTRLFCISGHVKKPGVYELPMGYEQWSEVTHLGEPMVLFNAKRPIEAMFYGEHPAYAAMPDAATIGRLAGRGVRVVILGSSDHHEARELDRGVEILEPVPLAAGGWSPCRGEP